MAEFSIFSIPPTRTDDSQWLYTQEEIDNSPSILIGHSKEIVQYARDQAIERIWTLKDIIQTNQMVVYTAVIYVQRFYMQETIDDYDPLTLATAAFYLASKVEERLRKIKVIIGIALRLDKGIQPIQMAEQREFGDENSQDFILYRKKLVFYEETILRNLAMDLTIRQPQWSLLKGVDQLGNNGSAVELVQKGIEVNRTAWKFINDSLASTLSIRHRSNVIAAASVVLACACRGISLPLLPSRMEVKIKEEGEEPQGPVKYWIQEFEATVEEVQDAIRIMLNHYHRAQSLDIRGAADIWTPAVLRLAASMPPVPIPEPIPAPIPVSMVKEPIVDTKPSTSSAVASTSTLPLTLHPKKEPEPVSMSLAFLTPDASQPQNTSTSASMSIPISVSISITDDRTFQPPPPQQQQQQQQQQYLPQYPESIAPEIEDVDMFSNNESPKLVPIDMKGESSNEGDMK